MLYFIVFDIAWKLEFLPENERLILGFSPGHIRHSATTTPQWSPRPHAQQVSLYGQVLKWLKSERGTHCLIRNKTLLLNQVFYSPPY